jgi:excisionase family DNA binding protein
LCQKSQRIATSNGKNSPKGTSMSNNLLTTAETASILNLTSQTVHTYAKTGRLKASFFGRRWHFRDEDVQDFIHSQKRGS